jgi:hypothetical protein
LRKISIAAYARNHDVSPQAASKWKVAGHLVIENGKVIVDESDARLKVARLGRYCDSKPRSRSAPRADSADPGLLDTDQDEPSGDGNLTVFMKNMAEGRTASKADAATIKENSLALKHTLTAKQLNNQLMEKSEAENIIFAELRRFRDAMLNWPSRVAPLIAANLKIDNYELLQEQLAEHIYQALTDLGGSQADFGAADTNALESSDGGTS